jgi:DNA-binding response OmpR family regulator
VHILIASDAAWIADEVTAALGGPDTSFVVCREGRLVSKLVAEMQPDLAIVDLQVGSMGGMAITLALRNDESSGRLPHTDVLMLLDRQADVYLAQRSLAEGWLIKPLDALRLQRAVAAIAHGRPVTEGVPEVAATVSDGDVDGATAAATSDSSEEEPVNAG